VTGAPASGKTSVAAELARRLHVPFMSKDTFKETLYEVLGSGDEIEPAIERAGLALLFAVVESQLEAGTSAVAESNFDSSFDVAPIRRIAEARGARLVQVYCSRDEDVLLARFAERAESGERHPGHGDGAEDVKEVREKLEAGVWDPLDLPGELIELDVDDAAAREELVERLRGLARA
jgi:predicted kinase